MSNRSQPLECRNISHMVRTGRGAAKLTPCAFHFVKIFQFVEIFHFVEIEFAFCLYLQNG